MNIEPEQELMHAWDYMMQRVPDMIRQTGIEADEDLTRRIGVMLERQKLDLLMESQNPEDVRPMMENLVRDMLMEEGAIPAPEAPEESATEADRMAG